MPARTSTWTPPLPKADGFEHLAVETPGLRTHVAAIGEGEPVVMLHGFPQHWWQWREIAPAVAAQGYRVLCPDLRGLGWTVADNPRIERHTHRDDLLALLDELGLERAHLVSHDYGSVIAWQVAYEHPDRIRSSVQLSVPPPYMRFSPSMVPGFRHMPRLIWHRTGASLRHLLEPPKYLVHELSEDAVAAYLAPLDRADVDGAVRPLLRRFLIPEIAQMASGAYRRRHLTVPTLIVFGRQDGPWTEEVLSRACRDPQGRFADRVEFAYVDDAAHYLTDDAPDEVSAIILDWFGRTGA